MFRSVALVLLLLPASGARCETACPTVGIEAVKVAAVDPRLELRLVDGRRLRLIGLDPAGATPSEPDLADKAPVTMAAEIAGKPVSVRLSSDKPDRWGRLPALAFLDGDPSPGGMASLAIALGLGRYLPEPAAHACRDALLAGETQARSISRGLWRDPYYGVLAVDDREAFVERSATTVVAEAKIWRVDAGPFRTKLRFATANENKHGLLVAVVLPKVVKQFEGRGLHFDALIGRTVRLRGLLDLHFGPQIELGGPDAMEILPETSVGSTSSSEGAP